MFLAAAAAKSLQSCPTLWDPTDGSPPGSPVPGILQARTLEWVAISFSNAWKWSRSVVSDPQWPHGLQPSRLLHPWDFPGRSTGVECHCLLHLGSRCSLFLWHYNRVYQYFSTSKSLLTGISIKDAHNSSRFQCDFWIIREKIKLWSVQFHCWQSTLFSLSIWHFILHLLNSESVY